MIEVFASFVESHFIGFNLFKSKLLCFNCDTLNVPVFFNGKRIMYLLLVMIDVLVT